MALNLQHQTPAQFAARLRQRFLNSTQVDTWRIATWMLNRIEAGDITELQARTAFGLTLVQWAALKTKLTTMRVNYLALQSAGGE